MKLAEDRATPLSDVDIAVYLTEGKLEDKRFQISGDLIDIFRTDKVDLVILNTTPLILKKKRPSVKWIFSQKVTKGALTSEYLFPDRVLRFSHAST